MLIFDLCVKGYGPSQIADTLKQEHILSPVACFKSKGVNNPSTVCKDSDDYYWNPATISYFLDRQEYIGDTINFRTYKKSYKSKKSLWNDKSNWMIFKNTHESIIDEET